MITVVNYGIGNIGSMLNMLKHLGLRGEVQSDPKIINNAKKIILPGVGSFDAAMTQINSVPNLRKTLEYKVIKEKVPILGVCLGMQLLTSNSEEGKQEGFGWIPAKTKRFPKQKNLKIPHMGWNIALPNEASLLTKDLQDNPRYYFVHSFYVQVDDEKHSIMKTQYGITFDSAIGFENIYGVQFHPEKSHKFGMKILKNFSEI